MAKVIAMCGKICSGKSTLANELRVKYNAAVLSVDEITLALFGQNAGEKHDEHVARIKEYLFRKSLELIETGINVILDWGFWTKCEREHAKTFYASQNIECTFYYIDIGVDEWRSRIAKRNADVLENRSDSYFVDEGTCEKV